MPCESLRFGGYGTYGLPTTELLADSDLINEIAPAGKNVDRAGQIAAEIGDKASVVRVDGTAKETLAKREMIGVGFALVVLLIVFGAAVAVGLPI